MRFDQRVLTLLVIAWAARAQQPPPQAVGYSLSFHDEFDRFDSSKWFEGVWFNKEHAPLSNISVQGSALCLRWQASQVAPDTSITTLGRDRRHLAAWRYGYFEARMKWDVAPGAWPALWMIPVQDATGADIYNGSKESGEIDIFEGLGTEPHTFYGTIHDWVDGHDRASKPNHFAIPGDKEFSQFHTYGLRWEPGSVTWYFDNEPLHSEQTPAIMDKQDFFLVIGMQEGVDWKIGRREGVSAGKLDLTVDWVRVWQKSMAKR